jgi:hypothetical protein
MWPCECHAKNIERKSASWCDLVDIEVKRRFLTILRAILNSDRYARNIIPVSIVSLMYVEHVLRVPVDWPTLPSTRFGCLSEMYQMKMVGAREAMTGADGADGADGVSTWPDRVSIGPDGVLTGLDGVLTGADGVADGPDGVLTGADGADGADGVSTGHDGVIAWPDGVEIKGVILVSAQEQSKLLADVVAYKARVSFWNPSLPSLVSEKTMIPSFGVKNSLMIELWNNLKIKRKTEHQCPQL